MPTYAWGSNSVNKQLADQTATNRSSPVLVVGSHTFTALAAGGGHGLGLKTNGEAWAWGENATGGLGDNTLTGKSSPVLVVGLHSFTAIAAGSAAAASLTGDVSAGLKADGTLWTWGYNGSGSLGDQTTTNKSSPVLVVGSHSFTAVSASGGLNGNRSSMYALKANGEVWSWGSGANGQLGDQTTTAKSSPVLVVGAHSFIAIASASSAGYGLKADGSVWAWGQNANAQLGDNTTTQRSSPVLVVGAHSFMAISGGNANCLALKSDGSVWAWGSNGAGALGDQTTTSRSSPVLVVGNHSFIAISAGKENASSALKANGQIWTWGYNLSGELGNQTITSTSSPVLVVGSIPFVSISAGGYGTVGTDDQAWMMGTTDAKTGNTGGWFFAA